MSDTHAPAAARAPFIRLRGVTKSFDRGRVPALRGVDLDVAAGEFVAVTGNSGSGKSTLLHLIAALDVADDGEIVVDGFDVRRLRNASRYRRDEVGIVFQLHDLLPHLDASQNVQIAMFGSGRRRREREEAARDLLASVGLGGKLRRYPPELSGGERQRVAIARALANDPAVLLADEPTGSLDSEAVIQVMDLFASIREDRGLTVILVTHDLGVAAVADRRVHIVDGVARAVGSAAVLGEGDPRNIGGP